MIYKVNDEQDCVAILTEALSSDLPITIFVKIWDTNVSQRIRRFIFDKLDANPCFSFKFVPTGIIFHTKHCLCFFANFDDSRRYDFTNVTDYLFYEPSCFASEKIGDLQISPLIERAEF